GRVDGDRPGRVERPAEVGLDGPGPLVERQVAGPVRVVPDDAEVAAAGPGGGPDHDDAAEVVGGRREDGLEPGGGAHLPGGAERLVQGADDDRGYVAGLQPFEPRPGLRVRPAGAGPLLG